MAGGGIALTGCVIHLCGLEPAVSLSSHTKSLNGRVSNTKSFGLLRRLNELNLTAGLGMGTKSCTEGIIVEDMELAVVQLPTSLCIELSQE